MQSTLGAELCLFKYEADPTSERFGMPLAGPPHAIYLDPQATSGRQLRDGAAAAPTRTVLNRKNEKPLRPSGDARGWKWRESLLGKAASSLIFEGQVAHREHDREVELE